MPPRRLADPDRFAAARLSEGLLPAADPGRAGRCVALDADGEALARAVEGAPYLVKPNRRELEGLTGRALDSAEDVRRGALGSTGAFAWRRFRWARRAP